MRRPALANRAFLRRVVRYLVRDAGITQILDIGSGLPTQGNVHEVAQEINPSVRTIYVDNDPVVCIHGQALLADARTTEVVAGDVRGRQRFWAIPSSGTSSTFGSRSAC